jgi:hypothetical protein
MPAEHALFILFPFKILPIVDQPHDIRPELIVLKGPTLPTPDP